MSRSRTRIRQRPSADAEEQKQLVTNGQNNVPQYGEHLVENSLRAMEHEKGTTYLEKNDYNDLDIDEEPMAKDRNHPSLLGTSLTALGVMEFSRSYEENHVMKFSARRSVRFSDTGQRCGIDKMQMKYRETETSLEKKEREYCFDFDDDVDVDSYLTSPQNPDVEEAFDLDP